MEMILLEYIKDHASEAMKSDIASRITTFLIAWWFVKRTIKEHFQNIEAGIHALRESVDQLKSSIVSLETSHGLRITNLEDKVKELEHEEHQPQQTKE